MEFLRERNATTTIYFPMVKAGSTDFATNSDWTPAAGDVQYSVDGGAFANTNTTTPTYEGNGVWSLPLLAAEVNGKATVITIIDSTTKAVADQSLVISTFGDDSAQIPLNAFADYVLNRNMASARASSRGDGTGRFILQAFAFLRNFRDMSGGTLTVKQENDTTDDWTAAYTTSGSAEPVTEIDPT